MKKIALVAGVSLLLSVLLLIPRLTLAQTSTDTNPCFSVNQSYYSANGYRAPYSQITLSDKSVLTIKNQSTPSILENFVYTFGGAINPSCAASNLIPHISVLSAATSLATTPWSAQSNINTGVSTVYGAQPVTGDVTLYFLPNAPGAAAQTQYYKNVAPYEDAIINAIDKNKGLTFVGQNGSAQVTSFLPMTNCVALSGSGPQKIVFMRSLSHDVSLQDYLSEVNSALNTMKGVDPYKTYWNQFSFYVDLAHHDDSQFPLVQLGSWFLYKIDMDKNILPSSCLNSSAETDVFITANPIVYPAWTFQYGKTVLLDELTIGEGSSHLLGFVLSHELGHAIGGLNDEYVIGTTGVLNRIGSTGSVQSFTNCSIHPGTDYRGSDGQLYGSVTDRGCSYLNGIAVKNPTNYYRPSTESNECAQGGCN